MGAMFNRVSILTIFPLGSVAYAIGDKERMCSVILGHWDGGTVAMETCRSPTTPFRLNHSRAARALGAMSPFVSTLCDVSGATDKAACHSGERGEPF